MTREEQHFIDLIKLWAREVGNYPVARDLHDLAKFVTEHDVLEEIRKRRN